MRRDHEDRGDGGERQLEAGGEQRVGIPAEEHRRADEQRLPAVALSRDQPGERSETRGERGPHNRRMEPDGERIRRDREQSCDLGEIAPAAGEEDDRSDPTADGSDFQPVDGETVVEARSAEVRQQGLVEARGTS
jgi:hypothetical protein